MERALVDALRALEDESGRAAEGQRAMVRSLAAALEARDGYTGEHSDAVQRMSVAVARRLGLRSAEVAEVETVAVLHDIGKIGIPDHVLHKPGPLDEDEWALMRMHPVIGERILLPLPGMAGIARAVRAEHERWDGGGYPDGLAGEDIPLAARIVLACDAYHALVSDRPYRKALGEARAIAELQACAGTQFDPRVVAALLDELADENGPPAATADDALRRRERELRALVAIGSAAATSDHLEDVAEIAAEAALEAVGADALSISRWDARVEVLRCLTNVGELAPGLARRPQYEIYRLAENPDLERLVEGRSYWGVLGDDELHPLEHEMLREAGMHAAICVPILFTGAPWGELWATRRETSGPFDAADAEFLERVAEQLAGTFGRRELFGRMTELAFKDPLTGLSNRRAFDERLELAILQAARDRADMALVLCDVDDFKALNDGHGHQAGDEALREVAARLESEVAHLPNAMVARMGGDEFALVLEGLGADEAAEVAERARAALEADGQAMSFGVAGLREAGLPRPAELIRAADAALYAAKRAGRNRVCVAEGALTPVTWQVTAKVRPAATGNGADPSAKVPGCLATATEVLHGRLSAAPVLSRLKAVVDIVAQSFDASAGAVSWWSSSSPIIDTAYALDRRRSRVTGGDDNGGSTYRLDDYPTTRRVLLEGGGYLVRASDAQADPAERELLADWGMSAVLGHAVVTPDGSWLVEIYADGATADLAGVAPALGLLAGEAVRGCGAPVPGAVATAAD